MFLIGLTGDRTSEAQHRWQNIWSTTQQLIITNMSSQQSQKHVRVTISPAGSNQKWAKATILQETCLENTAGMILASVTSTKPQGAREADVQRFCFCGPHNSCTQPGLWDLCWPLRSRRQRRMPRPITEERMWENFFFFFFIPHKKQRNPLRC